MAWKQLEPTPAHLTFIILSAFLILYALLSSFIRNRLHLSEPPLATLVGIIFGPRGLKIFTPLDWGFGDNVVQEFTRVILGVQCFATGVELPKHYMAKNYKSLLILLGPVMAFGWLASALLLSLFLRIGFATALVIAACLTPTDPVLAASILSESQFADRVPSRIRHLLSAESGCNDGISFPFLFLGLSILTRATLGATLKKWFLITILWQCGVGVIVGIIIGESFNKLLRWSHSRDLVGRASYLVFYLLLAILSVGIAATLGIDDFLVAFFAGASFARDGWFASKTVSSNLGHIVDLVLNSTMFVFFGAIIPWDKFNLSWPDSPTKVLVTPYRLSALFVLILLFRRIPAVLAVTPYMRSIKTWPEAFFCGHFGPMGVGALFLAIEARAQLETDTSEPLPHPPPRGDLDSRNERLVEMIWPVICFFVLGSTMVHGLSTLAVSIGLSVKRPEGERASLLGAETDVLDGMIHSETDESDGE